MNQIALGRLGSALTHCRKLTALLRPPAAGKRKGRDGQGKI